MKTCKYCGKENEDSVKVCMHCGKSFLEDTKQYSPKSKLTAGLLGIFLGFTGAHRFYLGYSGKGITQIYVTVFTIGLGGLWGFVEGILILCGKKITTDAKGLPLRQGKA